MLIHVGMWSVFVLMFFDSACLSVFLCLSQTMISLSQSRLFFSTVLICYNIRATEDSAAFMASGDCLILAQELRKTMLWKDEWTAITWGWIYGDFFLHDNYLKSINKASLLTSHIYQKMLRQMSLVCILHVAAGCHQDHRQSDIIIRSVYCHLRKSLALFWYCWC